MAKKRSKKVKAKPVTPAKEDQEMHVDEAGPSTPTIPPESISEMAEPDNQAEKELNLESNLVDSRVERVLVEESVEESMTGVEEDVRSKSTGGQPEESQTLETKKMTMEERKIKFNELRKKMAESSRSNRASLVEEAAKAKMTARDVARLERQRKLAEILRTKADAEDRGEDVERQKNWEYTIEENDEWEKKLARKRRRADFEFHDDAHAARRKYKKELDFVKPDLEAYNKQKALAMSQGSGPLSTFNATGVSDVTVTSQEQRLAAEDLYRDANTLIYGDNKPSEDAIDRVVSKINKEIDKKSRFSRKRPNKDEGDITYINEHNRVFNQKIARYYDKYTAEIRASFERGTAL